MNNALVTRGLVKRYGRSRALDGLTLSVPVHSITGLVGRNGAGKTTWMMAVAGLVRLDAGEVNVLGAGPFDAARHSGRVSILPQDSELPLEARPHELLVRYARLQGLSPAQARESADGILAALNLAEKADAQIRSLSHGMRQRLAVAQAFIGHPELILLDEPLNGLDPEEADRLRRYILARRDEATIVISSHLLHDLERLSTHIAFVDAGRTTRMDTLDAYLDGGRRTLEEAYLERGVRPDAP